MEEDTTTKQPLNLEEEQLQAITGGTGGRIQNFSGINKTYDKRMLIQQHKKEGDQAMLDAENSFTAGQQGKAIKAFKEATMHYKMITHISNNP